MRSWKAALLAACAFAALVAIPGTASARVVSEPSTTAWMVLFSDNGYQILIRTYPTGKVQLAAFGDEGLASYSIPGRATPRGLEANFGRLGRVSVRFHRSARQTSRKPLPDRCKGRRPIQETGKFEGTIRFQGEQGFTSISASSADGGLVRRFRLDCPRREEPRNPEGRTSRADGPLSFYSTTLAAAGKADGRTVFLRSAKVEQLPRNHDAEALHLVTAGSSERRGRILIEREVLAAVEPKSLLASPLGVEPVTAALDLAGPFAGTGTYLSQAGSAPSWTGDLSVRLPGAGVVPLTGPGFRTVFCQGKDGERGLRGCEGKVAALLKPANGLLFRPLPFPKAAAPTPSL